MQITIPYLRASFETAKGLINEIINGIRTDLNDIKKELNLLSSGTNIASTSRFHFLAKWSKDLINEIDRILQGYINTESVKIAAGRFLYHLRKVELIILAAEEVIKNQSGSLYTHATLSDSESLYLKYQRSNSDSMDVYKEIEGNYKFSDAVWQYYQGYHPFEDVKRRGKLHWYNPPEEWSVRISMHKASYEFESNEVYLNKWGKIFDQEYQEIIPASEINDPEFKLLRPELTKTTGRQFQNAISNLAKEYILAENQIVDTLEETEEDKLLRENLDEVVKYSELVSELKEMLIENIITESEYEELVHNKKPIV